LCALARLSDKTSTQTTKIATCSGGDNNQRSKKWSGADGYPGGDLATSPFSLKARRKIVAVIGLCKSSSIQPVWLFG
jgi:hypothetical protein